jgi:predicted amidohydrolase YtcJ
VVDGHGGAVLPGFHDHHVHLRAWSTAAGSVLAGPPEVGTVAELERRLRSAPGTPGSWVRAVGYHESVAGELDRARLDRLLPDRPLRLQHRTGALWMLNSKALEAVGLGATPSVDQASGPAKMPTGIEFDAAGHPTGRLWRADQWLHLRLAEAGASSTLDLRTISRRAAALGVTGFTDATPHLDQAGAVALTNAQREGEILQRILLMVDVDPANDLAMMPSHPWSDRPTGRDRSPRSARGALVRPGPAKVLLDDDDLPSFETLVSMFRAAHARSRPVAVHCVTRTQAALTVAALAEVGAFPGDRMEHGSMLGSDLLPTLRGLGITVVTQPGFVRERGDRYLADVSIEDRCDLWRLGSLLDADVLAALSTDAPFGPDDPWAVIAAAASRRTVQGRLLGPAERVSPRRAAGLFCGWAERPDIRRLVAPGALADLMVLAEPLDDGLAEGPPTVLATVVGGSVVHRHDAG